MVATAATYVQGCYAHPSDSSTEHILHVRGHCSICVPRAVSCTLSCLELRCAITWQRYPQLMQDSACASLYSLCVAASLYPQECCFLSQRCQCWRITMMSAYLGQVPVGSSTGEGLINDDGILWLHVGNDCTHAPGCHPACMHQVAITSSIT